MSVNEPKPPQFSIHGGEFEEARAAARKGEEYDVVTWFMRFTWSKQLRDGTVNEFVLLLQQLKAERVHLELWEPSEPRGDLLEWIDERIYSSKKFRIENACNDRKTVVVCVTLRRLFRKGG